MMLILVCFIKDVYVGEKSKIIWHSILDIAKAL